MIIILYFILGMLFIQIISPLIDGLVSLLLTIIEVAKGYFNVKIGQFNLQLKKDYEKEEVHMSAIGFAREEEEEYYDEV